MIYITGDTHIPIDIHKLSVANFGEQKLLCKEDTVIICGDFGGVWDGSHEEKYWLDWLEDKPFTTMFVDGNHENFPMLGRLEEAMKYGGKVHIIRPSIFHMMRGEIFTIDDKSFFAMGGASSHDMWCRTEGKNWWKDELPTNDEYEYALTKLDEANHTVDYIITHCAPNSIQMRIADFYEHDPLTGFFEVLKDTCKYSHWFFGHYHTDLHVDEKHTCVYHNIIPVL